MNTKKLFQYFAFSLFLLSTYSQGQNIDKKINGITFNQALHFLSNQLNKPTIEFIGYELLSLNQDSRCYRFSFLKTLEYDKKIEFTLYLKSDEFDQLSGISIPDVLYPVITSKFSNLEKVLQNNVDGLNFELERLRGKLLERAYKLDQFNCQK